MDSMEEDETRKFRVKGAVIPFLFIEGSCYMLVLTAARSSSI